jgi:hypothetical protein
MATRNFLRALALVVFVGGAGALSACHGPAAPSGSAGPVKITASWSGPADVDLHVIEPSGNEIYWGNTASPTGGALNIDANAGCTQNTGIDQEIVQWMNAAPSGTYTVRLDYYENCGAAQTSYSVTINNGSITLGPFTGTFTGIGDVGALGSGTTITTFTH